MLNKVARCLRLAARYAENLRALRVKRIGGIPETFWKLDRPWLHNLGIRSVIDVGANEGQFSRTLRALLPDVMIYAFEPIPECYERIRRRFAADPNYKVFNLAVGDRKTRTKFKVSVDTGASSLLPSSEIQSHYFPHARIDREIEVAVETLDEIMSNEDLQCPYLLKVDVQGYEYQVLTGGRRILAGSSIAILEASYVPFYAEQKLFDEVYDLLRMQNLRLTDVFNMMYDRETGQALQGDFLFLKD